jgi:GR25 family glycosyltransferase involved in LPS biosynthesis
MITIPVYVINLERATRRLDYISGQLLKYNIKFKRIDAIEGVKLESKSLKNYQNHSKYTVQHYSMLSPGEIGCTLSWHKAWALASNADNQAIIVLEDDVEISSNFIQTISKLEKNLNKDIVIDLSGKQGFLEKERKIINGITLVRYSTPPLGNQGAIYGKNAAERLLANVAEFKSPSDTLRQMIWRHGVQTWSLELGCLSHQTQEVGGSTIQNKKRMPVKIKNELMRPIYRCIIIARNIYFDMTNR